MSKAIWMVMLKLLPLLIVVILLGNAEKLDGKKGNQYLIKDNITVLKGKINIDASASASVSINYPSGFTKDNSFLLSCGLILTGDGNFKGYNYYGSYSDSSDVLNNAYRRRLNLTNENIKLWVENPGTSALDLTYKIVIMKSEVLDNEYTLGDVNQDGSITSDDVETINEYLRGNIALTEQQLKAADVIKDGVVDGVDIAQLNKYVKGIIDSLE